MIKEICNIKTSGRKDFDYYKYVEVKVTADNLKNGIDRKKWNGSCRFIYCLTWKILSVCCPFEQHEP